MAAKRPASPSGKRPDDAEGLHDLFDIPPSPTDYVLPGDGTRLVRPYPFDFVMHVKKRHEGLDVVTIFAKEFPARDRAYYVKAHAAGYLRVDNPTGGKQGKSKRAKTRDDDDGAKSLKSFLEPAKVEALRPLKAGERVRHFLHRHEPPVLSHPVDIVEVTDDLVAVHKPATVPVHPTGQYRKNTVLGILASHFPRLGWLAPAHRLDRNVSGLLLLARNGRTASALREAMSGRRISKTYVALVNMKPGVGVGVGAESYLFDRSRIEGGGSTAPLDDMYVSRSCDENGVVRITVSAPMAYDQATGLARCSTRSAPVPGAKDATTVFTVAEASESSESSGGESSESSESSGCVAVYCEPRTGRTHQIRAHLAHIGHPIANDVKYGGAATPIGAMTPREDVMMDDPRVTDSLRPVSDNVRHGHVDPRWPLCAHCPAVAHRGGGAVGRVLDAELDAIYLHCHRYRTIGTDDVGDLNFDFTCPHPPWLAGRTLRPLGDD